jgi:hypothetical protein
LDYKKRSEIYLLPTDEAGELLDILLIVSVVNMVEVDLTDVDEIAVSVELVLSATGSLEVLEVGFALVEELEATVVEADDVLDDLDGVSAAVDAAFTSKLLTDWSREQAYLKNIRNSY